MERRSLQKGLGGLWAGIPSWSPTTANPRKREVLVQRSPLAGFRDHQGESVWDRLRPGNNTPQCVLPME